MSQILERAKEARKTADGVRVRGHATTTDGSTMAMNLALTRTGGTSVITVGAQQITIIRLDKEVYLQGNDAFWTAAAGDDEHGKAFATSPVVRSRPGPTPPATA